MPQSPCTKPGAGQKAVALVIVLAFVTLISILLVAFYNSVSVETEASRAYGSGLTAKQISDSTVEAVMAQIRLGTSTPKAAWASQPGMIRNFDANGNLSGVYKLYSAEKTVLNQPADLIHFAPESDLRANWNARAGLYTDLNEPVRKSDGELVFPILDPRAYRKGSQDVQGFRYSQSSGVGSMAGVVEPSGTTGSDAQRVAMPVRWIYQLRDGTSVAAVEGPGGVVQVTGATAQNPIVGRSAYWTDDETCKVNLNTAAGDEVTGAAPGAFWDVPKLRSPFDNALAYNQPLTGEYQRYPGHPATVYLATVFPWLNRTQVAAIGPRISAGGSAGGTVNTLGPTIPLAKNERLYAAVDELAFANSNRALAASLTPQEVSRSKFFLTASSRAPDLTLFGTPRISLWPVSTFNNTTYRTAMDQLIAFCTTVGGRTYHFQRTDSNSAETDYKGIPRNQELYAYLQALTGQAVPGFGGPSGGFGTKYNASNGTATERDQILTEIFDAIRCVNLVDVNLAAGGTFSTKTYTAGYGQVIPIRIGGTRGFGRLSFISEACLWVFAAGVDPTTKKVNKVQVALLCDYHNPGHGSPAYLPNYSVESAAKIRFDLKFNDPAGTLINADFRGVKNVETALGTCNARPYGGAHGIMSGLLGTGKAISYPFVTAVLSVPAGATGLQFKAFNTALSVKSSVGDEVYRVPLSFPDSGLFTLPGAPTFLDVYDTDPLPATKLPADLMLGFSDRIGAISSCSGVLRFFTPHDRTRSLQPAGPLRGDTRLSAALGAVPAGWFVPHKDYSTTNPRAYGLRLSDWTGGNFVWGGWPNSDFGLLHAGQNTQIAPRPAIPSSLTAGALRSDGEPGDWDNGMGGGVSGPFINKADEGFSSPSVVPYYGWSNVISPTLFTPNRQISSAVQFGSLPSGVVGLRPWQTLLFRPDAKHPGNLPPKDHLLLDLFHMPTVEPYAISEPLSTAGRINMNYRIAPFSYITRETALRAALKAVWVTAIPTNEVNHQYNWAGTNNGIYRFRVNEDETLKFFEQRFNSDDPNDPAKRGLFVAASEICDVPLVPIGAPGSPSAGSIGSWWSTQMATGDNMRETPYNRLYPLLTTKSNTYTIHVRAQRLTKRPGSAPDIWDENQDKVAAEHRGWSLVERYIDTGDRSLPDCATNVAQTLEPFYRFRILGSKRVSAF